MAQIIKPLYDGAGNEIIPQTKAEAVDVGSGENLSSRLTSVNAQLADKVDKITGKDLSTEDYTTAEKAKVANLPLDTNAQLAEKANKAQEEWITPTLLNGYAYNLSGGYIKDQMGFVHLSGRVTGGSNANIFILPVGYRPKTIRQFIARVNSQPSLITVLPEGNVQSDGVFVNVVLDNISFRAEQ